MAFRSRGTILLRHVRRSGRNGGNGQCRLHQLQLEHQRMIAAYNGSMEMFFSDFAANLGGPKNPLYQLHERLKAEGATLTDLVRGNVNEHGIVYPPEILTEVLSEA